MTEIRTGASIDRANSRQDWATPWAFVRAVEARFGALTHDLAALAENRKAPTHWGPDVAVDSLQADWARAFPAGNLWLNPPFGTIGAWAAKCADEAPMRDGLILFLAPASVGANWFDAHVHRKALVLGLSPRLTFEGAADPYPKDLILAVYGDGLVGFDTWRWSPAALRGRGVGA